MVVAITTSLLLILCSFSPRATALTVSLKSTLTAYGDQTACRETALWMTSQWTAGVRYNCLKVIEMLERVEPEALIEHIPFPREFLPRNMKPEYPAPEAVRTPWKLINGPCTMAVTTLASVRRGFLPTDVGSGPFPDSGYSEWWDIRKGLTELMKDCVEKGEGGIRWFQPEPKEWDPSPKPALGVFFYATDSEIDKAIGPKTNTVLISSALNLTVASSR